MLYTRTMAIWCLVCAMAVLTFASFALAGLSVDAWSNPWLLLSIFTLLVFSIFLRYRGHRSQLSALTEIAAQLLLILIFGLLLTYAAVTAKFPYVDANLYAIDNAIGFDRNAYLKFFAERPSLSRFVEFAYLSMLPQFVFLPVGLVLARKHEDAQRMVIAVAIALLATALVSVFTPSLTAFVHVDLPKITIVPENLYTPEPTMEALRSGALHSISLSHLEGLVSFPSFHTSAAIIFVWTLCSVPYVRWLSLLVNAALISATPTVGAHYFIDLAGGVVVAIGACAASHLLCASAVHERGRASANNVMQPSATSLSSG